MSFYINEVDFGELEAEKYWAFPKSYKGDPKVEVKNMIFSNDYVGSRKIDGAYYRFIKDNEGNMCLIGRNRSVSGNFLNKINWVPQLKSFFEQIPNGSCLLGEIYFPNREGSSNVTTIMGCKEEKAIDRQNAGEKLHYYIFDIWAWDGESYLDKTIEQRVATLEKCRYFYFNECVEWALNFEGADLWQHLQEVLSIGGEGIVMTRKGTRPEPGKRPARKTLKVKKEIEHTIDCFFTGRATPPTIEYTGKEIETWEYWQEILTGRKFIEPAYPRYKIGEPIKPITKSYYNGWAGSLEIGVWKDGKICPIGLLSGLADEIKANYKDYKMKPIEVTCMEVLETGGLRHAKLLQFRPDLNHEDCTWEKFMG
jgi:hypothetical protein